MHAVLEKALLVLSCSEKVIITVVIVIVVMILIVFAGPAAEAPEASALQVGIGLVMVR